MMLTRYTLTEAFRTMHCGSNKLFFSRVIYLRCRDALLSSLLQFTELCSDLEVSL